MTLRFSVQPDDCHGTTLVSGSSRDINGPDSRNRRSTSWRKESFCSSHCWAIGPGGGEYLLVVARIRPRRHRLEVEAEVGRRANVGANLVERSILLERLRQLLRPVRVTHPRPRDEIGARRDRRSGVELEERQVADDVEQFGRPVRVQQLGADRDSPRLLLRQPVDRHERERTVARSYNGSMGIDPGDRRTDDGQRALDEARWDAAREAFESVLGDEETPEALDGLGLALWFLGDVTAGVAARERAVEGYARIGRCDDAARMAVWVSHQHFVAGRTSAAPRLACARRTGRGRVGRLRRARLGRSRAGTPCRDRRGACGARAPGPGDRAADRRHRPRGLRGQHPRARRGERGPSGRGDETARGGDGGRLGGSRPQRAHPRGGVLQPDRSVHQRRRLGARNRVVRARGRVRARARERRRSTGRAARSMPT